MDRHLVAVKVGIERRAHQRVDLDGLALDQHRLEGLNPQPVQRGSAIEQHRVVADNVFEDVPYHGLLPLHHFLGGLDRGAVAGLLQTVIDEGLEELERHFLGQAALVKLEIGTDHDHGAARVIHALAQQVLAEAALLPFQRVGQRLQGAVVGAAQDPAAPAVVKQRVHGLLQHPLFVAHDHVRSVELHEFLQPVVPVDDAPVKVIEVGGGKASAVERHERAQLRRNDGDHVENHVLRPVARLAERLDHFQALGVLHPLLLRGVGLHLLAHLLGQRFGLHALQQLLDRLCAHSCTEYGTKSIFQLAVTVLLQQVHLLQPIQVTPLLLQALALGYTALL